MELPKFCIRHVSCSDHSRRNPDPFSTFLTTIFLRFLGPRDLWLQCRLFILECTALTRDSGISGIVWYICRIWRGWSVHAIPSRRDLKQRRLNTVTLMVIKSSGVSTPAEHWIGKALLQALRGIFPARSGLLRCW